MHLYFSVSQLTAGSFFWQYTQSLQYTFSFDIINKKLCDNCKKCVNACPGKAISEKGEVDAWQCSVYYKGAHKSNPFMTDEFLKDNPERELILNGEKRFDAESARKIYKELDFLPNTQWGYSPCLCGRKCDIACYKHLKEVGKI